MAGQLGVGVIGAGPASQAIHLPVIASLAGRLRVTRVMDVDADLAARVAARAGAAPATEIGEVLDDPAVDIVAVCSPHQFHAAQTVAACSAGKRAVLCEKPLATTAEQAQAIAAASAASGVPVMVGAMHAFDPGYAAARRHWGDLADTATFARSVIYLPSNDLMVDVSTDADAAAPVRQQDRPAGNRSRTLPHPPAIRDAILGLAMHAIPLIREFVPRAGTVTFARTVQPWGYSVVSTTGDQVVQLIAVMPGRWAPDWTLRICAADQELDVTYPPSYVLAGSARAELTGTGGMLRSWQYPENGYQAEWAHLADVAQGRADLMISLDDAIADLLYAIDIAGQADALAAGEPQ